MRDEARLDQMRSTLAVDGYHLSVDRVGSGFDVRITAGPGTCADCLVPKPVMVGMLRTVLGVEEDAIRLTYPGEQTEDTAGDAAEDTAGDTDERDA